MQQLSMVLTLEGTLGEYLYLGRNDWTDRDWYLMSNDTNVLKETKPIKKWQDFVKSYDAENVFVCSVAQSEAEQHCKREWLHEHYPSIKDSHIMFVSSVMVKEYMLETIYQSTGNYAVLIDSDMTTVNHISGLHNEHFSAAHLSEFINDEVIDVLAIMTR